MFGGPREPRRGRAGGGSHCAAARGLQVHAWLLTEHRNPAVDAQLAIARAHGVEVYLSPASLPPHAVWIDGLLGTGSRGAPKGPIAEALLWTAQHGGPAVSSDAPAGVDVETGAVPGRAFRADITVTLARSKLGLHITPGPDHAGEIVIADIGISGGPPGSAAGLEPFEADGVGNSVHGRAGDLAAEQAGVPLALEIRGVLPHAAKLLRAATPGPREPRCVAG